MAESKAFSYTGIDKPILPYRSYTSPIDTSPHFAIGSQNVMGLSDGFLRKRPGFSTALFGVAVPHGTIQRMYLWERWDSSFFILVSTVDGTNAYVYQARIGVDTGFNLLFQQNNSQRPFDFVVSRNLIFFGNGDKGSMQKWDGGGSNAQGTPTVSAGAITAVTLTNNGKGYFTVPRVTFNGNGVGATATASIIATVTEIDITNGGFGYTSAPTISFTSAVGSGAAATATVANGAVTAITITNGGSGYTFPPMVVISGGGVGGDATAVATINYQVAAVNMTNGGTGYGAEATVTISGGGRLTTWGAIAPTAPPTITFTGATGATATAYISSPVSAVNVTAQGSGYTGAPTVAITGGGGTGATAVASIALDMSGVTYKVVGVSVTNGGSNYTSAPTVTFSGGGGGTGAAATAVISNVITSVTLTNSGSAYTSAPTVVFTGGGGSGAAATATVTSGLVSSVSITISGSGYTSAPTISFTGGGGTGAAATANLSYEAVTSVVVNTGGTGYSEATPPNVTFSGGGGSGATATAVVSPSGSVTSISVTNGGSGYTTAPSVAIDAGGISAYTNYYWGYTYTTIYGHETNMSPLSAASGIFTSRIVQVSVMAGTDVQFNGINIYRTTDGGSTDPNLMQLVTSIANQNYTYPDSTPDVNLGITTGPAFYANTPPTPCYGFVPWNSRLWGFKDATLYYSGFEEISNGVPEEAWPGEFNAEQQGDGNYQPWPQKVQGLAFTPELLAIGLAGRFYSYTGDSLDTFRESPLLAGRGVRAVTAINSVGNTVIWNDRARQLWIAEQGEIGKDIRTDLKNVDPTQSFVGMHVQGVYHWMYLLDPANGILYTYDIDLGQWNTPWTVPGAVAIVSGELSDGNPLLYIAFSNGMICSMTDGTFTDNGNQYSETLVSNPMGIAAGGDSTARNRDLVGQVQRWEIETNGILPSFVGQLNDDIPSAPNANFVDISNNLTQPYRRAQGSALIKSLYQAAPRTQSAERVTIKMQWPVATNPWELYGFDLASSRTSL